MYRLTSSLDISGMRSPVRLPNPSSTSKLPSRFLSLGNLRSRLWTHRLLLPAPARESIGRLHDRKSLFQFAAFDFRSAISSLKAARTSVMLCRLPDGLTYRRTISLALSNCQRL